MKRLLASIMCVMFFFLAPVSVKAENIDSFDNAGELYEYWTRTNSLPNYITGVWSSDGGYINLTLGVTNDDAGREGAKQILELVADDNTVSIAYQTYALHYLYEVQEDLERYMEEDLGFKALGVYFLTNRVEVDVDQKRLDDPATTAAVDALSEKYGDAVFFKFTNTQYSFTIGPATGPASGSLNQAFKPMNNQANWQMLLFVAMSTISVVCLVALFFSEYRRRKLLVLLTNTGAVTVQKSKTPYKAIVDAVINASSKPSAETDLAIRSAIAQQQKENPQ